MKKIIIALLLVSNFTLAASISHSHTKRTSRYGYSEQQRDYKEMRNQWHKKDRRGGYYNHKYHNQGTHFRPNDEQFIAAGKKHKHKHKHKR